MLPTIRSLRIGGGLAGMSPGGMNQATIPRAPGGMHRSMDRMERTLIGVDGVTNLKEPRFTLTVTMRSIPTSTFCSTTTQS